MKTDKELFGMIAGLLFGYNTAMSADVTGVNYANTVEALKNAGIQKIREDGTFEIKGTYFNTLLQSVQKDGLNINIISAAEELNYYNVQIEHNTASVIVEEELSIDELENINALIDDRRC